MDTTPESVSHPAQNIARTKRTQSIGSYFVSEWKLFGSYSACQLILSSRVHSK